MSDDTAIPRTARVELLETLEPTVTDKTRYDAGTTWTFPEDTALALVEAGKATLLSDLPAAAAAPAAEPDAEPAVEPAAFVGDEEE